MTVFDAERLILSYRTSPARSALLEAAAHARLVADLAACGLPDCALTALAERLGVPLSRKWYRGMQPIPTLAMIAGWVDRRPALGVERVELSEEQRYRLKGRDASGLRGREAA